MAEVPSTCCLPEGMPAESSASAASKGEAETHPPVAEPPEKVASTSTLVFLGVSRGGGLNWVYGYGLF